MNNNLRKELFSLNLEDVKEPVVETIPVLLTPPPPSEDEFKVYIAYFSFHVLTFFKSPRDARKSPREGRLGAISRSKLSPRTTAPIASPRSSPRPSVGPNSPTSNNFLYIY